jgi:hypothetical protein
MHVVCGSSTSVVDQTLLQHTGLTRIVHRFVRPPSGASSQAHAQRLAAASAARSRTVACLTFPAAALILYLAVFGVPGRSRPSAASMHVSCSPCCA